jgi:hypothetical protein
MRFTIGPPQQIEIPGTYQQRSRKLHRMMERGERDFGKVCVLLCYIDNGKHPFNL